MSAVQPSPPEAPPAAAAARQADLWDRLAITVMIGPTVFAIVEAGGLVFLLGVLTLFGLAAWEYARLFAGRRWRPAGPLIVAGVLALIAAEQAPALNPRGLLVGGLIVAALTWHLVDYERGAETSGLDFVITLGGIVYLGGLGRYFVTLRALPDGLWWLLAALTSMWLGDSGAYIAGRLFGRRRMTPRLSPKKTWEGFAGSVLAAGLGGGLLSLFWGLGAGPASLLNWQTGLGLGLLVGALGPLGDLGVSMLKRQVGVKDTGTLLGSHGGALDRIDSWLVAVAVGYYYALALPAVLAALGGR
jgi:phosphatidate cytidylyltransferase